MLKIFVFQWLFYGFSMGFVYVVLVKDFDWEVKFWFGLVVGFGVLFFVWDAFRIGLV